MDATEAREIAHYLSDEEVHQMPMHPLQVVEREEAEQWVLQSVSSVLQQLQQTPGHEVNVEALVRQLERLPRKARAHQLVRLLRESREESIPKHALLDLWGKFVRRTHRQTKSATCIPILGSRALAFHRKQADCDLQLLQNRIALLQHEEAKAWKEIAQTKDRAEALKSLQLATLHRHERRCMHQMEQERQARSIRAKQVSQKQEAGRKKQRAVLQMLSKRAQDVEHVKAESQKLKAERERVRMVHVAHARAKRERIRRQEDAWREEKARARQTLEQAAALRSVHQAIAAERQRREHSRRVKAMEDAEREVLAQLQGTQRIQREAYSVLERTLLRTDLKRAQSVAPFKQSKTRSDWADE